MGHGSYTAADWSKLRNSRNLSSSSDQKEIFKSRQCDPRFDPKFIQVREARDSQDHPESTPIIIGLDVTGSMGYLSQKVATEALNETMMKLYSTNVVKDPALMFAAYGDYNDDSPLQVTQFESDIRVAEQRLDRWLADGGAGQVTLSLLWYFAAKHTSLDSYEKRHKKGFLFIIGDTASCRDQNLLPLYPRVFGEDVQMSVTDILHEAQKKFEVFHLFLADSDSRPQSIVERLPGHTMLIAPGEIDAIPEILISVMQMVEGKSMEDAVAQWSELKRPIVTKALKSLKIESKNNELTF